MKIKILNLALYLTQRCNLNCAHCLCGNPNNLDITDTVLDKLFSQVDEIFNLGICGGEISLATEKFRKVLEYIKKYNVKIDTFNITTNATLFSEDLISIVKDFESYVKQFEYTANDYFAKSIPIQQKVRISLDHFHVESAKQNNYSIENILANVSKYKNILGENVVISFDSDYAIINSGRAVNINENIIKKQRIEMSRPCLIINDAMMIGGIVTVNCLGDLLPINLSYEEEKANSYGNLSDEPLLEIIKKLNLIDCKTIKEFYDINLKEFRKLEC